MSWGPAARPVRALALLDMSAEDTTPDLLPMLRLIAFGSAFLAGTVAVLLIALDEPRGAVALGCFAALNLVLALVAPLFGGGSGRSGSREG